MASKVHIVRHAESVHNVDKDFDRLDPGLTDLGYQQAQNLGNVFPYSDNVGLVISSPLRRAIQTTLLAFINVLDKIYYEDSTGKGIKGGAKLVLDPDLQERSALPCDSGSDQQTQELEFPNLDFSHLEPAWTSKVGIYAVDDDSVGKRAAKFRGNLREKSLALKDGEKGDIVIVTHGVFMKF